MQQSASADTGFFNLYVETTGSGYGYGSLLPLLIIAAFLLMVLIIRRNNFKENLLD